MEDITVSESLIKQERGLPSIPFGATVDAGLLMWLECLEETENPKQPDPLHQTQFQQLVNQAYNGSLD